MENEFGQNVRYFRQGRKMKQETLASEIGRSVGYVSRIETGTRIPSLDTATRISNVLGIPLDLLFQKDLEEHSDTYKELVQRLEHYPPKNQKEICTLFLQLLDFLETYEQ